ncbi:MAG: patatin-like phospholipase family protein, partial [Planctomycetota bacterium]
MRDKHIFPVFMLLLVAGCSLSRNPVPIAKMSEAEPAGLPGIRAWDISYRPDLTEQSFESSDCSFLAISGGGANGAFGAGFLKGWTASGKRPNFRIVTGISTGALIAPLAFLGADYDETLEK